MLVKKITIITLMLVPILLIGWIYLFFTGFCFEQRRYLTEAELCETLKQGMGQLRASAIITCKLGKGPDSPYLIVGFDTSELIDGFKLDPVRAFYFTPCGKRYNKH